MDRHPVFFPPALPFPIRGEKARAQPALKETAKKRGRFFRDSNDLIRRLAIELEIKFRLRPAVFPVGKRF